MEVKRYTGSGEQNNKPLEGAWNRHEPYRPDDLLIEAVEMAIELRRPLLLEGDPGAGKTRLAYAVAWELGWPLHDCYVRSTSKTEDLLYEYEQLNRLYDIQASCALLNSGKGEVDGHPNPLEPLEKADYLTLHPLGRAIEDAQEHDRPSVVLIDEIDKADIDFPNDLLQVLEEWRFSVKEVVDRKTSKPLEFDALKGKSKAKRKEALPLVIITSNRERDLPPAFLRRCLYYFIEFPKPDKLVEILRTHFEKPVTGLFETAVKRFMELRGAASKDGAIRWQKKPGASELIDWVMLLERKCKAAGITVEQLEKIPLTELPFRGTLVKKKADLDALKSLGKSKE